MKTVNILSLTASNLAKIQTGHLPNTSLENCHYINLLSRFLCIQQPGQYERFTCGNN